MTPAQPLASSSARRPPQGKSKVTLIALLVILAGVVGLFLYQNRPLSDDEARQVIAKRVKDVVAESLRQTPFKAEVGASDGPVEVEMLNLRLTNDKPGEPLPNNVTLAAELKARDGKGPAGKLEGSYDIKYRAMKLSLEYGSQGRDLENTFGKARD